MEKIMERQKLIGGFQLKSLSEISYMVKILLYLTKREAFQNTNIRATKTLGPYLSLKPAFEYIHPAN